MNLEALNRHQHIIRNIKALWGTPELDLYLSKLMLSDRNERYGFDAKTFIALNNVLDLHRFFYHQQTPFHHPTH